MSVPPWFNKDQSIKKIANDKEDRAFKHILSGALSFKGDFSTQNACIDLKSTKHKSISVTEKMLDKLLEDSLTMGKEDAILLLDLPRYYVTCRVQRKGDM